MQVFSSSSIHRLMANRKKLIVRISSTMREYLFQVPQVMRWRMSMQQQNADCVEDKLRSWTPCISSALNVQQVEKKYDENEDLDIEIAEGFYSLLIGEEG